MSALHLNNLTDTLCKTSLLIACCMTYFCPRNAIPLAQYQHITLYYIRIVLSQISSQWASYVPSCCMIWGFRGGVNEFVALLGCYVA